MFLLLILWTAAAQAEGKNASGTFSLAQAAQVNDVNLKPGLYDAKFNAETSEVSISKGGRTIITVKVSIGPGEGKSNHTQVESLY